MRPTFRFDIETLASMTPEELEDSLATIEAWSGLHPDDRSLDSAWRVFRNELDHRRFQSA